MRKTLELAAAPLSAEFSPATPGLAPSSGTFNQSVYEAGVVVTNGNNTLTGNDTISGTVSATAFVGNGSGLTNVTAASAISAASLNCIGCIGNPQLGVNYAASSAQGGDAANALMLGGQLPGAFQPAGSLCDNRHKHLHRWPVDLRRPLSQFHRHGDGGKWI